MAITEIAVKADVSEIENLIDQLKDLQTYKLHEGAEQTLVDLDDVVKIFTDHVEAEAAQPEPLSDAYMKAVWAWLFNYQIKMAELHGRYTPYEVLSWVANDWRKEHETDRR